MTYRHKDGSFSAFGPNSYSAQETGGTWLTAFVLRCLADTYATNQIEIDVKDLKISFELLLSRQRSVVKFYLFTNEINLN